MNRVYLNIQKPASGNRQQFGGKRKKIGPFFTKLGGNRYQTLPHEYHYTLFRRVRHTPTRLQKNLPVGQSHYLSPANVGFVVWRTSLMTILIILY